MELNNTTIILSHTQVLYLNLLIISMSGDGQEGLQDQIPI